MVAVDSTATTSAATAPVHSPAIAPCPIRDQEGRARLAATSPATTGAHPASSMPATNAAS